MHPLTRGRFVFFVLIVTHRVCSFVCMPSPVDVLFFCSDRDVSGLLFCVHVLRCGRFVFFCSDRDASGLLFCVHAFPHGCFVFCSDRDAPGLLFCVHAFPHGCFVFLF